MNNFSRITELLLNIETKTRKDRANLSKAILLVQNAARDMSYTIGSSGSDGGYFHTRHLDCSI